MATGAPALSDADMSQHRQRFPQTRPVGAGRRRDDRRAASGSGRDRRREQHLFRLQLGQRLSHGRAPSDAWKDDGIRYGYPRSASRHGTGSAGRCHDRGDRREHRSVPDFHRAWRRAAVRHVDGRSLVPLLHGQKVADWRTVALIEHHGPVRKSTDPDLPGVRSGNPTTYEAMRAPTSLYVEYTNGEKEYHDLATDPDELHNSFASLSGEEKTSLHAMIEAVKNCHDAKNCWAAEHANFSAMR